MPSDPPSSVEVRARGEPSPTLLYGVILTGAQFLLDVDSVLTDGGMCYSESGEELKVFNTGDCHGITLPPTAGLKTGLKTAIVTRERTAIVTRRARS